MNARQILKIGAIGLLLAVAGFIFAIGALTLILGPRTGANTSPLSSDAAAWIQAVGSIAAIAAAYWLGERQARRAREQALELYHLQRMRIDAGARGIIGQLYGEVSSVQETTAEMDFETFSQAWNSYLRYSAQAAVDAFDNMPIHELGTAERVHTAFEMRAVLQHALGKIDAVVTRPLEVASSLSAEEQEEALDQDMESRSTKLRTITAAALERQNDLRDAFERTYEKH